MTLQMMNKTPQIDLDDDEAPSVSTTPWTSSQGPLPALVGTTSLSKCSFNLPNPLLMPHQDILSTRAFRKVGGLGISLVWDVQLFV